MWPLHTDHSGLKCELSPLHSPQLAPHLCFYSTCLPGCKSFASIKQISWWFSELALCFSTLEPLNLCSHHLPWWNVLLFRPSQTRFISPVFRAPTAGRHWASTFTCVISSCKAQHKFLFICEASVAIPTGSGHFLLSLTLIVCTTHLALNTS